MQNRKRKLLKAEEHEKEELEFEKRPRLLGKQSKPSKKVKVRNLLPIKVSSGKFVQQTFEEQIEEESDDDVSEEFVEKKAPDDQPPKSVKDLMYERKKEIEEKKALIAKVASEVVADPQANFRMIKQLRLLLEDRDSPAAVVTIRKLVIASLGCLFVDIIPGYRIRERTEKEKKVKLSKEVKALTEFEEGLLHQYQIFLKFIEKTIKHRTNPGNSIMFSREASRGLGEIAIHALADLYKSTSHFNFHHNITLVMVPIANDDKDLSIRQLCCDAISVLFKDDKRGGASLTTIKTMALIAKKRGPRNIKPEFLSTLMNLRIKNVDYSMIGVGLNKAEKAKKREEDKKLSRRQKKQLKKERGLRNELKEVAATEDKDERTKIHTEIVQQIFLIYFRILKHKNSGLGDCRKILPTVLEGLSKYAHLINIDFFSDLLKVLQQLVCEGKLTVRENLHCIFTVFQILSGQGEVINVDPAQFYAMMYTIILELTSQNRYHKENLDTMLNCVDRMFFQRRKQVTLTTLCAFVKRLLALAMQLRRPSYIVKLLSEVEKLLDSNSKTSSLFDVDSAGLGNYQPEIEDPNYSKGHCAVMWDLHLARRHYVPLVRKSANQLLRHSSNK